MKFTVTLQIEITDAEALNGYIKDIVAPEFCLHAEDVSGLTPREALIWIYDNGASWPGTAIVDCSITAEVPEMQIPASPRAGCLLRQPPRATAFALPAFIPW
jgi:hypothetical protein